MEVLTPRLRDLLERFDGNPDSENKNPESNLNQMLADTVRAYLYVSPTLTVPRTFLHVFVHFLLFVWNHTRPSQETRIAVLHFLLLTVLSPTERTFLNLSRALRRTRKRPTASAEPFIAGWQSDGRSSIYYKWKNSDFLTALFLKVCGGMPFTMMKGMLDSSNWSTAHGVWIRCGISPNDINYKKLFRDYTWQQIRKWRVFPTLTEMYVGILRNITSQETEQATIRVFHMIVRMWVA